MLPLRSPEILEPAFPTVAHELDLHNTVYLDVNLHYKIYQFSLHDKQCSVLQRRKPAMMGPGVAFGPCRTHVIKAYPGTSLWPSSRDHPCWEGRRHPGWGLPSIRGLCSAPCSLLLLKCLKCQSPPGGWSEGSGLSERLPQGTFLSNSFVSRV